MQFEFDSSLTLWLGDVIHFASSMASSVTQLISKPSQSVQGRRKYVRKQRPLLSIRPRRDTGSPLSRFDEAVGEMSLKHANVN
jgi:hypothetical protein